MRLELERVFVSPLLGVSLSLDAGVYCFLAGPAEGAAALVDVVAGVRSPRRGKVRIDGAAPHADPASRRSIGALLSHENLPRARSVAGAVEAAARFRAQRVDARSALELVGVGAWADRRPDRLEPAEARTVALAIALSVEKPKVLALHEPYAAAGPGFGSGGQVAEALEARAADGAVVVVTTASVRDAFGSSARVAKFENGRMRWLEPTARQPFGADTELVVRTPQTRRLAALLVESPHVGAVEFDEERSPGQLSLRSGGADRAAVELARLAREHAIEITAIEPRPASLEILRAASAGHARAAYEAAYHAAWATRRAASARAPELAAVSEARAADRSGGSE